MFFSIHFLECFFHRPFVPEPGKGYSTKFHMGSLRLEVQSLILWYTILTEGIPFALVTKKPSVHLIHLRKSSLSRHLTVNSIIQGSAPPSVKNLITEKRTVYNLRGNYFNLSIPKVNMIRYGVSSRRDMLQQSTGMRCLAIFSFHGRLKGVFEKDSAN